MMHKAISIMIVAAALLLASAACGAEFGKERPIAITVGSEQLQPAIDGHIVAWADNRSGNYDIFMYDLETGLGRWVCIDPFFQLNPAVSGERIVWQDMRSGNGDIYLYDVVNRTESAVITAPGNQTQPDISGDRVVWADDRDGTYRIYLYDLNTKDEKTISSGKGSRSNPRSTKTRLSGWINVQAI